MLHLSTSGLSLFLLGTLHQRASTTYNVAISQYTTTLILHAPPEDREKREPEASLPRVTVATVSLHSWPNDIICNENDWLKLLVA